MEGRESPQQLEIPFYECRQRSTTNASSSAAAQQTDECACGPDGLLSCVEEGVHSSLINNADSTKP